MLHSVPTQVNALMSTVMMNHPNSMDVVVYRKHITRADQQWSGQPTIGGMTSLSSTDEEQFEYARLGRGYAMPAESFQGARMVKSGDANIGGVEEFRFCLQCAPGEDWVPKDHDVFFVLLEGTEDGPSFAFEIVGIESTSNIPPFNLRYICNRRDGLFD